MKTPLEFTRNFYDRIDPETEGTDRHFTLAKPLHRLVYAATEAGEIRDAWMRMHTGHPRNRDRDDAIMDEVGDTGLMICSWAMDFNETGIFDIKDVPIKDANLENISSVCLALEDAIAAGGGHKSLGDVFIAWVRLHQMYPYEKIFASMIDRAARLAEKNGAQDTRQFCLNEAYALWASL